MTMNKIRIFSGAAALLMGISLCACGPSKVTKDEQPLTSQVIDLPEYSSEPEYIESPNSNTDNQTVSDSQVPSAEPTPTSEEYDLSKLLIANIKTGQAEKKYIMEELRNDFESYDREDGTGKTFITYYSYRSITDPQITYEGKYLIIEDANRNLQSMNTDETITTPTMKIENAAYLAVSETGNPYADCKTQITGKDGRTYVVDTGEQYYVEINPVIQSMEIEPGTTVTIEELQGLEVDLNLEAKEKTK